MVEWFDDLAVGMRFKSQEKVVTREDIKRFASEFDPQPYHLDEAAAEQTRLKGLAASGWHTAAIAMRLAVDLHPFGPHPLFGLGVDELRWLAPVRPGIGSTLKGRWSNSRRLRQSPKALRGSNGQLSTNMAIRSTRLLPLALCRVAPPNLINPRSRSDSKPAPRLNLDLILRTLLHASVTIRRPARYTPPVAA